MVSADVESLEVGENKFKLSVKMNNLLLKGTLSPSLERLSRTACLCDTVSDIFPLNIFFPYISLQVAKVRTSFEG